MIEAKEMREKGMVKYQKQITMNDPDVYAEVTLQFEGLRESRVAELRKMFNEFFEEVEGIAKEDSSLCI